MMNKPFTILTLTRFEILKKLEETVLYTEAHKMVLHISDEEMRRYQKRIKKVVGLFFWHSINEICKELQAQKKSTK